MSERVIQEISLEAEERKIFEELIKWGQAQWWPRESLMEIKNLTGQIKEGTVYHQKVKLPFAPYWHTKNEIVDESNFYIKRVFLDGVFKGGYEEVRIVNEGKVKKIIFSFSPQFHHWFDRFSWKILFKYLHKRNINRILNNLKRRLEE